MTTESAQGIQPHIQAQNMQRGFTENAELPALMAIRTSWVTFLSSMP
jgi:hypothetical protein